MVANDSERATSLAELMADRAKMFVSGVHGLEDSVSVGPAMTAMMDKIAGTQWSGWVRRGVQ